PSTRTRRFWNVSRRSRKRGRTPGASASPLMQPLNACAASWSGWWPPKKSPARRHEQGDRALALRRAPQAAATRPDGIEQRPVALGEHMPLRKWRAQFQPERAQHAIVAVVALQDDAGEHCGG